MKFVLSLLILNFGAFYGVAQNSAITHRSLPVSSGKRLPIHQSVTAETDKIYEKLVRIRRDFHENPELAGKEKRTRKMVSQYLLDLGIEVDTNGYGYGVVGMLKGAKNGKTIIWRADMDALSSQFPDPVEFRSKVNGVQHGCGHDVHLAVALGIAEVLAKHRESLKGTVYFIFQPEEETFLGAKGMIADGLLAKIKPDEIYGLHVTALPTGQIMVKPREVFAYQKRIRLRFKNEFSKEEVKTLSGSLRNVFLRAKTNSRPWEIQQIVNPETGLGNPNTIFNDFAFMEEPVVSYSKNNELLLDAYLYETTEPKLDKIIANVKQILTAPGDREKLLSVSFTQENPTVINDVNLTENSIALLDAIYGDRLLVRSYGQVPYFNDDFAYFQQQVKGVYFLLGGSNAEKGMVAMNHAPNFNVDEESIRIGVRSFSSLIIERLDAR